MQPLGYIFRNFVLFFIVYAPRKRILNRRLRQWSLDSVIILVRSCSSSNLYPLYTIRPVVQPLFHPFDNRLYRVNGYYSALSAQRREQRQHVIYFDIANEFEWWRTNVATDHGAVVYSEQSTVRHLSYDGFGRSAARRSWPPPTAAGAAAAARQDLTTSRPHVRSIDIVSRADWNSDSSATGTACSTILHFPSDKRFIVNLAGDWEFIVSSTAAPRYSKFYCTVLCKTPIPEL